MAAKLAGKKAAKAPTVTFAKGDSAEVAILGGVHKGAWVQCKITSRDANGAYTLHILPAKKNDTAAQKHYSDKTAKGIAAEHLRPSAESASERTGSPPAKAARTDGAPAASSGAAPPARKKR